MRWRAATGQGLGAWRASSRPRDRRRIVLLPPPASALRACDARFLAMMARGGAEAKELLARALCTDSRGNIFAGGKDGKLLILNYQGNPIASGVGVVDVPNRFINGL